MKFRLKRNWLGLMLVAIAIAWLTISIHAGRAPAPSGVTVKLSGWTASPVERSLLTKVLADFTATHPGINVKYEAINDQYMDVIKTRLIGEAAPDIFYLDALEAPFLMEQNVLEPLDKYIQPEFAIDDFEQTLIDSFKSGGRLYGLPKDYSTLSLFYDRQAFKAGGLTEPPSTWEQLREYSQQLTVKDNTGKTQRYGFGETAELARQAYTIKAFGGQIIDDRGLATFATTQGLQGLEAIVSQYRQEHTSAQKSDVGTSSGSEMLGQKKVAMTIEGNWAIPYLQETFGQLDFATAQVPKINNRSGTMVFTVAYVMNKASQHKDAAWQLISYLTGKEGMAKWTKSGLALPARKSVAQQLGWEQDRLRSAFVAGVKYATPWQVGKYPAAIRTNFDNQFLSAMLGEQPLVQAMAKAQTEANRQIATME